MKNGDGVLSEASLPVFIVEDDDSVQKALKRLLKAKGYRVMTFASAEDFLLGGVVCRAGCLILDIRLPGMSGPDLYKQLASSESDYPVILMTFYINPQYRLW